MFWNILRSTYEVALEAAPWLVLGLFAAGLIHAFLPPSRVSRWLGGHGIGAILKAALLGAPLPLCSCGVLPVAVGLRKAGASRGATASFMVSTPETGVDSVSVTYALMGPVFAVTRFGAAVVSATVTGMLVEWFAPRPARRPAESHSLEIADQGGCGCGTKALQEPAACCRTTAAPADDGCCGDEPAPAEVRESLMKRLLAGQRYAATRLIDDLAKWLALGIIVAGVMNALIAPDALAEWGAGPAAYAIMLLIGLPMYVCATASTPIAASMLLAGVSPGPALVFLMAGPATNLATLGVLKRELGVRSIAPYLLGVGGVALLAGLTLDALFAGDAFRLPEMTHHAHGMLPGWLAVACLLWLCFIAMRPLRRAVFRVVGAEGAEPAGARSGQEAEARCCEDTPVTRETCCSHSS